MMELFNKYKNQILAIAGIIVAFFIYSSFFKPDPNTPAVVASAVPSQAQFQAGREVLVLLVDLKSLSFDSDLFENEAFQSLSDWSTPIPTEPQGRPNPFAPLGADPVTSAPVSAPKAATSSSSLESINLDLGDLDIDTNL